MKKIQFRIILKKEEYPEVDPAYYGELDKTNFEYFKKKYKDAIAHGFEIGITPCCMECGEPTWECDFFRIETDEGHPIFVCERCFCDMADNREIERYGKVWKLVQKE